MRVAARRAQAEPAAHLAAALRGAGIDARVELARASLRDVFVAATQPHDGAARSAA